MARVGGRAWVDNKKVGGVMIRVGMERYIYIYTYAYMFVHVYICVYACRWRHMFTCICICMYTYIHIGYILCIYVLCAVPPVDVVSFSNLDKLLLASIICQSSNTNTNRLQNVDQRTHITRALFFLFVCGLTFSQGGPIMPWPLSITRHIYNNRRKRKWNLGSPFHSILRWNG